LRSYRETGIQKGGKKMHRDTPEGRGTVIDLSLPIYHMMPAVPTGPKVSVVPFSSTKDQWYTKRETSNNTQLVLGTHSGTHMDAPYHFIDDGLTIDQISLARCVGEAFVVDLSNKGSTRGITVEDLEPYEDRIVKCGKLLLYTGWDRFWGQKEYFQDTPYLTADAAIYLATKIHLIGTDVFTIDRGTPEAHRILLGNGIIIVEALTNLDKIAGKIVYFIVLPLNIKGRDGAPVRAIAFV